VTDDVSVADLDADPEARLSFLEAAGVVQVHDDEVTTSAAFEDTRTIYADSYAEGEVSESELVDTVVQLFDVDEETARERIESGEVSRHGVVTYLSLQSFLDRSLPRGTLALLADMVAQVGFGSAVPERMEELTDETYADFLADAGDALVFVWKYPCDPCRDMKGEIPALLERLPEDIAVAGVDGEEVVDFRREFQVEAAPEVLAFADGELAWRSRGYTPLADLAAGLADVYDEVDVTLTEEF